MNNRLVSLLAVFIAHCAVAAYPVGRLTVRVMDDTAGGIVSNATVIAAWRINRTENPWDGATLDGVEVKTDENGEVEISARTSDLIQLEAHCDGFYSSTKQYGFTHVAQGKWQPENPLLLVKLSKIGNRIPVYSRQIFSFELPDWTVGYDFLKGDFVAPYGSGTITDCQVSIVVDEVGDMQKKTPESYRLTRLLFEFPGKFNGVEFMDKAEINLESEFKQLRYAHPEGYMTNQVFRQRESRIIPASRATNWISLWDTTETFFPQEECVFFRVRSECNPDGSFKSAFYGKLRIPDFNGFTHGRKEMFGFYYWLNPTRNDRNMEFDESKNLFDPKWQKGKGKK